jgi:hypothetical protein
MASPALQLLVSPASPALKEALPNASTTATVLGSTEGEDSDKLDLKEVTTTLAPRNLHLEAAFTSEDARFLEILCTTP